MSWTLDADTGKWIWGRTASSWTRYDSYWGGKHQALAKMVHRLVDSEPRRIGSKLKEHATRFTEIDGMEVLAVDHRRGITTDRNHLRAQRELHLVVRHPPGDVVDGPGAPRAVGEATDAAHINEAFPPRHCRPHIAAWWHRHSRRGTP